MTPPPTLLEAMQDILSIVTGDLRAGLHGESFSPDDFEAQLRNVRGLTITVEAIARTAIANAKHSPVII